MILCMNFLEFSFPQLSVEFDLSMIDELTQSNQAELSLERAVVGLLSCRRGSGLCQIIKQTLTEVERPHEKMILILGWRGAEQQENWCQSILLCRLLITQTYKNPHHKASSPNRLEKNAHYSSIMKRTNRWQQNFPLSMFKMSILWRSLVTLVLLHESLSRKFSPGPSVDPGKSLKMCHLAWIRLKDSTERNRTTSFSFLKILSVSWQILWFIIWKNFERI